MKNFLKCAKLFAIIGLFAGTALITGCNAADLTGAEAPETEYCRGSDCPNGHNL